jgi:hypothetical protein
LVDNLQLTSSQPSYEHGDLQASRSRSIVLLSPGDLLLCSYGDTSGEDADFVIAELGSVGRRVAGSLFAITNARVKSDVLM